MLAAVKGPFLKVSFEKGEGRLVLTSSYDGTVKICSTTDWKVVKAHSFQQLHGSQHSALYSILDASRFLSATRAVSWELTTSPLPWAAAGLKQGKASDSCFVLCIRPPLHWLRGLRPDPEVLVHAGLPSFAQQ